jgi:hypothetical protein
MLCGRAAIVTDVGGHSEIINDGVTGFLAQAPTVSRPLKLSTKPFCIGLPGAM